MPQHTPIAREMHKRAQGKGKKKIGMVMGEFKRGTLHSGSGGMVTNKKQALAIAMEEARKRGAKIPKR